MLVISRKQNETITIEPLDGIDPGLTLKDAFEHGAIEIRLIQVGARKVRLAIDAPREMRIWRGGAPEAPVNHADTDPAAPVPLRTVDHGR